MIVDRLYNIQTYNNTDMNFLGKELNTLNERLRK